MPSVDESESQYLERGPCWDNAQGAVPGRGPLAVLCVLGRGLSTPHKRAVHGAIAIRSLEGREVHTVLRVVERDVRTRTK